MNSCEFATIEEAFGAKSLKAPEPPSLRGNVADIHDVRAKAMDTSIRESHRVAQGSPGAPSCFGNANAGADREVERCPAGMAYCSACARRHRCPQYRHHRAAGRHSDVQSLWKSLSHHQKMDLSWLMLHHILTSDITLLVAFALIVYLLISRR